MVEVDCALFAIVNDMLFLNLIFDAEVIIFYFDLKFVSNLMCVERLDLLSLVLESIEYNENILDVITNNNHSCMSCQIFNHHKFFHHHFYFFFF